MANRFSVNFQGNVIEVTVTNKASEVERWVSQILTTYSGEQIIVGLDCEWKPNISSTMNNTTATLQLCVASKCIIIQMFYLDNIPQSIKNFLDASNVTLVGVEVQDDVLKLQNEYGLRCNAKTADIQAMAMARWPVTFNRKPGLKKLASDIVGLHMAKPLHVCRSNWEARVLSAQQIEYACIDAFASYKIGSRLLEN
ncbi:hypothetical protein LIER_11792 [Lithospermum erythrorhizon]|uniref:3'-5' exonuclease domain-containing protein n=1 Tax=Lithospermum erythrorhizon TaxID=34254 RepID=A0AAV3PSA1_LITER